jgi:hypothetical protein
MARKQTTASQQQLLDQTLAHLTATIKDLSPQAEVEITFEQYEDEDAHVYVHPPADMTAEEIDRLEAAIGERCNEMLLDTGLFIVSAVCDS